MLRMGLGYLPTRKPIKINHSRRVKYTDRRPMDLMGSSVSPGTGWTASTLPLATEVLAQVAALKLSKKKVGNMISKHKA